MMGRRKASSKSKGSSFEREFAKYLSLWWTGGKDARVFWRTHGSGSMGPSVIYQGGDIGAIKPEGIPLIRAFCFECKRTKRYNILDFFSQRNSFIEKWVRQVKEESGGRIPVLVFKMDRRPMMVGIPSSFFGEFAPYVIRDRLLGLRLNNQFDFTFLIADHFFTEDLRDYIKENIIGRFE